jgi:hypothetical protein
MVASYLILVLRNLTTSPPTSSILTIVLANVATFERKSSLDEEEGNSSGLFLSLPHRDSAMILQVIITPQPSLHCPQTPKYAFVIS